MFIEETHVRLDKVKKRKVTLTGSVEELMTVMGPHGKAYLKVYYKPDTKTKNMGGRKGLRFQSARCGG
jgi:hypothetical protein